MLDAALKNILDEVIEGFPFGSAYAGIGSRECPDDVQDQMAFAATYLAHRGWILRSGGAAGADTAFERGAVPGQSEIFLPWKRFNSHSSRHFDIPAEAFEISEKYHPSWSRLPPAVQKLMARNAQQILGKNLYDPSEFVLCWTPDGADGIKMKTSHKTGGTGQAIRIAAAMRIPVINMQSVLTQAGEQ